MNKKECKWYPVCPIKYYTDAKKIDRTWIQNFCLAGNWENCVRYQKEEANIPHPDNMLPDGTINKNLD